MPYVHGKDNDESKPWDHYHSQAPKIRVICVGAGAAGLLVAYKMKKQFADYELVCYDKNPSVGGTWYENRYPGCACDVPAHAYTYSFEGKTDFSSFYAYAPEIKSYFEGFTDKYELQQFIKLNSRVLGATWDESKGIYDVDVEVEGKEMKDWAHVVINGTGFLNDWKWPKIPGLETYKGQLVHTANWDPNTDYKDKTVAIIGTGSSAIQTVPQIQKSAKSLTTFMRSVTWISPPIGVDSLKEEQAKEEGKDSSSSEDVKVQGQYFYSEDDKQKFRDDPKGHLAYRQKLEAVINANLDAFITGSETSETAKKLMREEMKRRIGPGHEDLKEKLIPTWSPGCRRLTPGDGYLEALVKPNVNIVHEEIEEIVPDGLVDAKGTLHKVDILVCATGFNLAFAPKWEVRGTNGVKMSDEFDPEPNIYLAMAVPKFPNFFIINGLRGCWANGSSLPPHEACVDYIMKCCRKIQNEQIRALEIKEEPTKQLNDHIDAWHAEVGGQGSVWNQNCKSWYKDNKIGGKLWIWGGSALHFMKTIEDVHWEHYDHRYRSNNMWAFLGNGKVKAESTEDKQSDKLAPYVRDADTPWHIE